MSGEQNNTHHAPDWNEHVEEFSTVLTLGQMIDGFRQLSDEDRSLFMRLFDLQVRTAANHAAGGAIAPTPVIGVIPAQQGSVPAIQPAETSFPLVQGAHASQLAALGQPGFTKDPKSGKTYRVVAKAARSQEFLGLENNALRAKQALDALMKRHCIRFDRISNKTVGPDSKEYTPTAEYTNLVDRVKTANLAVKAYKQSHPEQFRPPQKKGGKVKYFDLPSGLMAPPPLGGSTHTIGNLKNQGSSSSGFVQIPLKLGGYAPASVLRTTSGASAKSDEDLLAESLRAHKLV
jgi:hypothetical protein